MTGMQKTMQLELVSAPESVALVRSKLRQFGANAGLEPELIDDLALAISEACNNVVLHAYRGDPGKLRVSVVASDELVDAEVSDSGIGIEEPVANDDLLVAKDQSLGLGVALIQALAQQVVFADGPGSGMAVRMSFVRLPFGESPRAYRGAAHNSGRSGVTPRREPASARGRRSRPAGTRPSGCRDGGRR